MKDRRVWIIVLLLILTGIGCGSQNKENRDVSDSYKNENRTTEQQGTETVQTVEGIILDFVDVHGTSYQMKVDPRVKENEYKRDTFVHNGTRLSYGGDDYTYRLGIDVSHYQGEIDWDKVKEDGIEFVIIRIGYRGYGEEGTLKVDTNFEKNIQGARAAGLDVGVYFFSQAINEEEAVEEAEFVLGHLASYDLQLPIVYDPESILHDKARTDYVSGEQFTKNTKAFCETIEDAGYDAMIYCNMLWQAYELDLKELEEYPIWYADYEAIPQTPYHFEMWQYSQTGTVNGIQGNVDMNIQMIKK